NELVNGTLAVFLDPQSHFSMSAPPRTCQEAGAPTGRKRSAASRRRHDDVHYLPSRRYGSPNVGKEANVKHTYRVGIDIGGTFTDIVVARDDGLLTAHKVP